MAVSLQHTFGAAEDGEYLDTTTSDARRKARAQAWQLGQGIGAAAGSLDNTNLALVVGCGGKIVGVLPLPGGNEGHGDSQWCCY